MQANAASFIENNEIMHVGVDLAKSVFQVAYKDFDTGRMRNYQLSRAKFKKFITESENKPMVVALEACGSAYYWGRLCEAHGHKAMVLPAEITNKLNIGNKDDHNDAHAIWQASYIPGIKTVRIRDEKTQAKAMLLKFREFLLGQQTAMTNFLKSVLYEYGEPTQATSIKALGVEAGKLLEKVEASEGGQEWSSNLKVIFDAFSENTEAIAKSLKTIKDLITEQTGKDDLCKRLMTIPYVGPICAFALANSMVDPANFDSARQFADFCGFAPYHTGTGGKVSVLGVARKGNRVLKRVLYEASSALVSRVKLDIDCAGKRRHSSDWIKGLTAGKPYKKAACAVANKICRIAWAIASVPGATYDQEKTSLVRVSDDSEDRKEAAANKAESGQVEPAPVLITTIL